MQVYDGGTVASGAWAMNPGRADVRSSRVNRINRVDATIVALFPLSFVIFCVSAMFVVHRPPSVLAFVAYVGLILTYSSCFVLPVWIAVRNIRDRDGSPIGLQFMESSLGGLWLFGGLFSLLDYCLGDGLASVISVVASLAILLTPLVGWQRK